MALIRVEQASWTEGASSFPLLVWRAGPGWRMVSSAVAGGGLGTRRWVMNAQVPHGYDRTDPAAHLAELARSHGLKGPGVGLLTAADVAQARHTTDDGVEAVVTTGLGVPVWAAAPDPSSTDLRAPGTVNVVVAVPAVLSDAALVNLVATVTEAKTQALLENGWGCTGTASDAVCVAAWDPDRPAGRSRRPEPFGGPRSDRGSRTARAVHAAVGGGARHEHHRRQHRPVRSSVNPRQQAP